MEVATVAAGVMAVVVAAAATNRQPQTNLAAHRLNTGVPQLIPNVFSDLDLNLIPHPTKRAVPRLLDADAVKRSVRLLVMTKHHERLFHPEIGCDATQILFEPVSPITEQNLKRSIEDVINNFEPRARLRSVVVKWDVDNNAYQANIEFFIANNPAPVSLGMILERVR